MMDGTTLVVFIAAGLLLNLTPGPDVLNVVTSAMRGGLRAGSIAALGVAAGCFVHIAAAAFGIGAMLAASAQAFTWLKWLGAAYLLWSGWKLLRSRSDGLFESMKTEASSPDNVRGTSVKQVFWRAFLTNALNPKVALFFLAFVPQFIAPTVEHKALAFLMLGLLFNVNGLLVNLGWALAAAGLARRVARVRAALVWIERAAGLLFIGFGLRLALADAPASSAAYKSSP